MKKKGKKGTVVKKDYTPKAGKKSKGYTGKDNSPKTRYERERKATLKKQDEIDTSKIKALKQAIEAQKKVEVAKKVADIVEAAEKAEATEWQREMAIGNIASQVISLKIENRKITREEKRMLIRWVTDPGLDNLKKVIRGMTNGGFELLQEILQVQVETAEKYCGNAKQFKFNLNIRLKAIKANGGPEIKISL